MPFVMDKFDKFLEFYDVYNLVLTTYQLKSP